MAAKKKGGIKKLFGKISHPFDVLLDVALAPGKLAVFAPLAPLFGVMELGLKKKGAKVMGSKLDYPENLARQFYQVVILKKPPLTQGVGLADKGKHHLESADDTTTAATGGAGGAVIDQVSKSLGGTGLVGSLAGTALQIIHGIIKFITANKKKVTGQPLTKDEQEVSGDTPPDKDMAASSDKVQDTLVTAGVGNVTSDGTHVADVPDYGHGFAGWLRKMLHTPLHKENLESLLNALESC
jgi:hypothetical protein